MAMKRQFARTSAILAMSVALFCVLGAVPGRAITARDVTEKMSQEERYSYLTGLIDMRAFIAGEAGDANFSKCVYDAYYRKHDSAADPWIPLLDALKQFPDKQPATIVFLLAKKACGG